MKAPYPNRLIPAVLWKLQQRGKLPDAAGLAATFHYKTTHMVDRWLNGVALPEQFILPQLAFMARIEPIWMFPPWLADQDQGNIDLYMNMAWRIIRDEDRVKDLMSGRRKPSRRYFWEEPPG